MTTPQLFTHVEASTLPRISTSSRVVSLGSCFADEIGHRMADAGIAIELNPFGTLYNPASIATALRRLVTSRPLTTSDLVEHEGLWHSWHHHGSFSRPDAAATLAACNSRLAQAAEALRTADILIVTFGTAWVFEHEGMVVANCHKLPSHHFVRRRMSVSEIATLWHSLLPMLRQVNPKIEVLMTVSPIRHLADGAHGNQLSKSTLLLAVDELCASEPNLFYFPAYEIILDELRDYRFYASDMTHPTPLAADIVWHRLQEATMTPADRQRAHNATKQSRRAGHIPIHHD